MEPVEPDNDALSSKKAEPDPDWTPTPDPNATVQPGKMRSDREEVPAPFTKADADKAETLEAKTRAQRTQLTALAAPGCQTYWPAPYEVCGAIRDKYNSLGGPASFLSFPNSNELTNPGNTGKRTQFLNGPIYWSANTGAHPVVNSFLNRWGVHGYETGYLKYPTTDEIVHSDGQGRHQEFQGAAIYVAFQNAVGSAIGGAIRQKWDSAGGYAGPLGYPSSDEIPVNKNSGRYNNFVNGTITWSQPTGARLLYGPIRDTWARLGREDGPLGYPLADEKVTADNLGHFADFENGTSIWWTAATGAWPVSAKVGKVWNSLGGPGGVLGYPARGPRSGAPITESQGFQRGVVNVSAGAEVHVGTYEPGASQGPEPGAAAQRNTNPEVVPGPGEPIPSPQQRRGYDTSHIEGQTVNPYWPNFGTMVVRTGYYNGDIDDGWGFDKAFNKHNLQAVDSILFALQSTFYQPRSNGDPGQDFYAKARKLECDWFSGDCDEVDFKWVHAIYDPRKFELYKGVPAGDPLGLVTAYCEGQIECDSWVDVALTNPSNPN